MTFMKMRVSITREQSKKKSRNGGKVYSGLQDLKKAAMYVGLFLNMYNIYWMFLDTLDLCTWWKVGKSDLT